MANCLLCGVGGQGTVLASKLIAQSAMDRGLMARTAETIGMAQRGGCVVSHVRTGREIFSPMIPLGTADLILGFEPGEAVRCLPYLKEGGVMVASVNPVMPVTASLKGGYDGAAMVEALRSLPGRVILVDTEAICRHIGSVKVANVALLGAAAASGVLDVSLRELEETLEKRMNPKFIAINKAALAEGARLAGEEEKR